ncbi:elongation factor P domain protein, partial [Neisseria meningitidis 97018]
FYEGNPISVELPTIIVREVEYTEPAVKGDTSGKVMKTARQAVQNQHDDGGNNGHMRQPLQ